MAAHHTTDGAQRARLRDERALFERYAHDQAPELRDAIVERFLPLARSLAVRYVNSGEPIDDLVQVAALGLVKAVDRYDVTRGIAFSSYAVPTILGELRRYFRDRTWSVHVPRDLQELTLAVETKHRELQSRLQRAPSVPEIAHALDVHDDDVLEARQASCAQQAESLDAPADGAGERDDTVGDRLSANDRGPQIAENRALLDGLLDTLPQRSRVVLLLRFQEDMTQADISAAIGISQMQVSRTIRRSIARLRQTAAGHAAQMT
jgi:RNA polymerase sigma-B factor